MATKKLETSLTGFLTDAIDDTKKVVDDILKSAGSVEKESKKVGDDLRDKLPSDADIKKLRKRVDDLTKQIDKVAKLKKKDKKDKVD